MVVGEVPGVFKFCMSIDVFLRVLIFLCSCFLSNRFIW